MIMNPLGDRDATFSTFNRGLCAYNARILKYDVTPIEIFYYCRREFSTLRMATSWLNQ